MGDNAWIFVANRDNWIDCIESKCFGLQTKPGILKPADIDDPCVAYVTRESVFAGMGQITSPYYYDDSDIFADHTYPHRVGIEIDLDFDNAVDVRSLIDSLDFITDKAHWYVFFYSGAIKIPISDFEIIKGAIERRRLKPSREPEIKEDKLPELDIAETILSLPELTTSSLHDRLAEMLHTIGLYMEYNSVQRYKPRSDSPYQIDVAWLKNKNPQVAIEVHHSGVLGDALNRLRFARDFNFRKVILVIVEAEEHRRALDLLRFDEKLKHVIDLWSVKSVYEMYRSCIHFHKLYETFEKSVYKDELDKELL